MYSFPILFATSTEASVEARKCNPMEFGVAFCPDADPFRFLRLLGARWVSVGVVTFSAPTLHESTE
ncbi:hypothetical protein E2C01_040995 [Portunus trituberculatus]|uniref:Uncharacterized protein n=1 Tax=Portunus trituberculatus TaxID=210409 RepID=A0A5B7FQ92_PORTR|nr:hypothetical protein [Portunus trituberculatus]